MPAFLPFQSSSIVRLAHHGEDEQKQCPSLCDHAQCAPRLRRISVHQTHEAESVRGRSSMHNYRAIAVRSGSTICKRSRRLHPSLQRHLYTSFSQDANGTDIRPADVRLGCAHTAHFANEINYHKLRAKNAARNTLNSH